MISTFRITGPDAVDFAQGADCPVSPTAARRKLVRHLRLVRPRQRRLEVGQSRDRRRRSRPNADGRPQRKRESRRGRSGSLAGLAAVRRSHGRHDFRGAGGHVEEHGSRAARHLHLPSQRAGRGRLRAGRRLPVSPDTLPVGSACTIYVSFHPHSGGPKAASLVIGDSAPSEPADGFSKRPRALGPGSRALPRAG